ncbi:MAG: efflux transporter periplasmic adaptor subunit [Rhodovulum sulfidophilum]|uniref:Efflux transporter periplasmic adaptor subunit n=1 Tax=Rhodovulum sulfidophilum TaxID=35806 RepID=A0A2W5N9H6_RHOSU|nr:MAG: efflux transporter periplasmic adaptor subunit [Rhodovulum sulfidophilum]
MKAASSLSGRVLLTLAMVACAAVLGTHLWSYYMEAPWTRDGHVRADIVRVAPDVAGLVSEVLVKDNQPVSKGDVLFRIDPERFELALRQAEAQVMGTKAAMDIAATDLGRYRTLATKNVVSRQEEDAADSRLRQTQASYEAALASRDTARLNLERASVRAPVDGVVTNFSLQPGNYATVGGAVGALVDADSFYVAGYFEETKLPRIHVGDRVRIDIMGEPAPIYGHVASVAGGIEDRERSDTAGLLANVTPTFSWVRLAQRVPVRIAIDAPPDELRLVAGRSATVSVLGDGASSS